MYNPWWPICQTPKPQNTEQTSLEEAGHYGASLNGPTDHLHRCVCSGPTRANNIAATALLFSHTHKILFELRENHCSWSVHLFLPRTDVCARSFTCEPCHVKHEKQKCSWNTERLNMSPFLLLVWRLCHYKLYVMLPLTQLRHSAQLYSISWFFITHHFSKGSRFVLKKSLG